MSHDAARMLTSFEVFSLAVTCLEAVHEASNPAVDAIAVRNLLATYDERTLRRVAAALAVAGVNRQPGEDRAEWLSRLNLERLLAVDL